MKAGWRLTSLADVCVKVTDGSHFSPSTVDDGYPYITVRDLEKGSIDLINCKKISPHDFRDLEKNGCAPQIGDVLFSKDGTVGKVALVDFQSDFVVLSSLAIIRPKPNLLDSRYLAYAMQNPAFLSEAIGRKTGVAIRRVVLKNLKSIDLPLPPLDEQRGIVAVLDKAFAGIATATANAQKNLTNARALFESYLQSILSKRGAGWVDRSIGEIADTALGKMLDKQKNKGELHPYLRNINVRWFEFDLKDLLQMRFEASEVDRYSIKSGDVVICEGGYPGRAAIWESEKTIYYQKALHRVRFKNTLMARWFVYILYYADSVGDLKSHFTGSGIQHFTGQALKRFLIPVPPSDGLPDLIAGLDLVFHKTNSAMASYQRKMSLLSELKQSLLQKAFAGELT